MRKVMTLMTVLFLIAGLGFSGVSFGQVAASEGDQAILKVLKDEMTKKIIQTGTLDLYDKEIDAVRNLSTLSFPEEVKKQGNKFVAMIDYRDTNSGDIVTVEVLLAADGDSYAVEDVSIANVELLKKGDQAKKDYSDEEIQAFMNNYIQQQVKFTDSLMLYDEEREVMRHLKMNELSSEVRRMGIFYSSRGVFEDVNSGDILGIDIAVKNKDGKLELQALRVRSFKRGK